MALVQSSGAQCTETFLQLWKQIQGEKTAKQSKKTCNVITKDGFLLIFPTFLTTQETKAHKNK